MRDIHTDSWILINHIAKKSIVVFDSISKLPEWYRGSPLRLPIAMFSNYYKLGLIHGGVVERNSICSIYLGDGGSGKSTSVVKNILDYNQNLLADDYFAYDYLTGKIFPLYCSIKLKEDNYQTYKKFFSDGAVGSNIPKEKRVINTEKLNLNLSKGGVLHKIYLPNSTKYINDSIKTSDVYRAIIPSTLTGLMNHKSISIRSFSTLAHFKNKSWINWKEI